jgi:hypothetical protein
MSTAIEPASDDEAIAFAVTAIPGEGFEPHGPLDRIIRTVGELQEDYDRIVAQVLTMTANTPPQTGLHLKTVEVELAFNAEGELGFFAKAKGGVEASMKLVFERKIQDAVPHPASSACIRPSGYNAVAESHAASRRTATAAGR